MSIKRDLYLNKLINRKHNGLIKIISGLRRCGKSYLLFELFREHLIKSGVKKNRIITISLDNYEDEKFRNPDICYKYVKSRIKSSSDYYYLLLDEVQMMERFEDVLNGFLHIKNLDVYVTGSNSRFLSTDVVTEFRGRGDEIRVYPLSFAEYFSTTDKDWEIAWNEYCLYGGMPLTLSYKEANDKVSYLENLFKETYIKDIIERNKLRGNSELEELVDIIASNIGCLTNPKKLSDTFKSVKKINVSEPTIKNYIDYLLDAFVVTKALRYDIKGKKYINTPSKYYFSDIGLRNARLNFRQNEETHIMENIIFNELLIKGYNVDIGEVFFGIKQGDKQQRRSAEIDFIANKGNQRYYIQSALEMVSEEKKEQEEKSLLKINDGFKKVIIVKNNMQPYYNQNGIAIIGLKDFLLNSDIPEL